MSALCFHHEAQKSDGKGKMFSSLELPINLKSELIAIINKRFTLPA